MHYRVHKRQIREASQSVQRVPAPQSDAFVRPETTGRSSNSGDLRGGKSTTTRSLVDAAKDELGAQAVYIYESVIADLSLLLESSEEIYSVHALSVDYYWLKAPLKTMFVIVTNRRVIVARMLMGFRRPRGARLLFSARSNEFYFGLRWRGLGDRVVELGILHGQSISFRTDQNEAKRLVDSLITLVSSE